MTTRSSVVTGDDDSVGSERETRPSEARTDSSDLLALGEDLVTTAARVLRWIPRDTDPGLSLAAIRLLARISDHGPVRISDLAVAENSSQPTITNHVKKLESEDLVSRAADPSDARAWKIDLTEHGRERLTDMRHHLGTSVLPMISALSKKDQKALRDGVEAMRRLMAQVPAES